MHFYNVTPCIIEAQIDVSSYPSRKVYEPCWPHNFLLNPLSFSRQSMCNLVPSGHCFIEYEANTKMNMVLVSSIDKAIDLLDIDNQAVFSNPILACLDACS